jgi:ribose-phosphate pyrophosphokinase
MNVIGDVKGRDCILVDDIVDSGGTLINAAKALLNQGATSASVYVTHGVLSGQAVSKITNSGLEMLTITESIQATDSVRAAANIRQIPIAPLFADAISRIHTEKSVSSLFD